MGNSMGRVWVLGSSDPKSHSHYILYELYDHGKLPLVSYLF